MTSYGHPNPTWFRVTLVSVESMLVVEVHPAFMVIFLAGRGGGARLLVGSRRLNLSVAC
ncbi:hypothetical protein C8K44_1412 [Aminobacter sp. AP02]|nr:hypothetical protein C8K44_1412 [Aminobacter sp. AP02]